MADTDAPQTNNRKRAFMLFGAVLAVIAVGWLGYQWIEGERYVETDDAYVNAEVAQVTPLTGGPVAQVRVSNTQMVHRGDVLVVIDPTDARLALAEAQANFASAVRRVRQTMATRGALGAVVGERRADISRMQAQVSIAEADLARARIDLSRREALAADGGVSGEELTSARNAFAAAQGNLAAARASLTQAQAARGSANGQEAATDALVAGTTVETNPDVLAAKARLDQARIDLDRTIVRAPVDGVITQRNVQLGQRVSAGTTLMTIVPVADAYVDANYKESQLRHVRPGQSAELTADIYGGKVVYHGKVVGFSGGTGSALAVIPAQNATGNWIKVVQRLPVRIALDRRELAAHPLRIGLSVDATIDTHGN
ncbi:HlyD family efflux transporter periplasmic adaptor subunit [Novosphingobium sp. FSW06-99]|uniref:HlyD family efflux transporter periplasmic adaptor subunit n=1 Tax=Novosphingobium sp. FSW06-99 TaxID=1739113 RepID=UPI00076C3C29|nr:hemolysin D [Novosphingobium sp. FSW06-99]